MTGCGETILRVLRIDVVLEAEGLGEIMLGREYRVRRESRAKSGRLPTIKAPAEEGRHLHDLECKCLLKICTVDILLTCT